MRALVLSDSHEIGSGLLRMLEKIWAAHPGAFDAYVHCGDGVEDFLQAKHAIALHDPKAACYAVRGNCDWANASVEDTELTFRLGGALAFVCHGHHYRVKQGLDWVDETAAGKGCAITLYGHTHEPNVESMRTLLVNPGSAREGKYAILSVENGQTTASLYCL